MNSPSIYVIPPLLCLISGLMLATISIFKGRLKAENILFSLVCIWWSILAPVFIFHHLIKDINTILIIERITHFFYVFIIPINLLFYFTILKISRRWLVITSFVFSSIIALFTPTHLYIDGLYSYRWGYIAKGGVIFLVFGFVSLVVLVYAVILCIQRLQKETNQIVRRKIKYILFSINLMGILTLLNIPSMNGVDLYPAGNFMFIPLLIMAYGVLRYRLMDIKSILHISLIWVAVSSAIIIPNLFIFARLKPHLPSMPPYMFFLLLAVWFFLNYFYFRRIQPLINQLFNKRTYNLRKLEAHFIGEMSFLKNLNDWLSAFEEVIKKALSLHYADVYLKVDDSLIYRNMRGRQAEIDAAVEGWFTGANHLIEKNMVDSNPYYAGIRDVISRLFAEFECAYIVPLIQNQSLIGLAFLGEKANLGELSSDEVSFINSIRTAATIALSNSIMYQNLNNLKENLERIVAERTNELQTKNNQMTFELKVAKDVQKLILSPELPSDSHLRVVSWLQPLMEVSGDFFDVIRIDDKRTAMAIVDVSGHGVPSALLTSMIKSEIQSQLKKPHRSTADICMSINSVLASTLLDTGLYFTMFLCIIDLGRMILEYTNCGHTAAFLVSSGRRSKALWGVGFLIGAADDAVYECDTVPLKTGDRIYLYTDGITEARNSDREFFSEARLIEKIKESYETGLDDQLSALRRHVEDFQRNSPGSRKDDMTLVIAEIGVPLTAGGTIRDAINHFKLKEYDKAAAVVGALGQAISSPPALYFAARVHFRTGDMDRALEFIERALRSDPGNREFLYLNGKILYKSGRKTEARNIFHEIYEQDPAFRNISKIISSMKS